MPDRLSPRRSSCAPLFFFNATATTEIYTLSLHDALPIWPGIIRISLDSLRTLHGVGYPYLSICQDLCEVRSEEHTSELQSQSNLVCRLLLEKKKMKKTNHSISITSHTWNMNNSSFSNMRP